MPAPHAIRTPLIGPIGMPRSMQLTVTNGGSEGGGGTVTRSAIAATSPVDDAASSYVDAGPVPQAFVAPAGATIAPPAPTATTLATSQPYVGLDRAESLAAFTARYETLQTLRRGGEGHAVLVRNHTTGELAVAKYAVVPQEEDRRGREALALPRIHHPNVVRFCGLYFGPHPDIPDQATLWTVTDYVPGYSLADILAMPAADRPIELTEPALWEILRQLQDAITANEQAGVVHADLHPGNIIITLLDSGRFHLTVIDYGVSKVINRQTFIHVTRHAPARAAFHTPPELMSPDADAAYRFVRGTDRHFAGTVLLELMAGREISLRMIPPELLAQLRSQVNTPWSTALFDAIAGLVAEKPENRVWPDASSAHGLIAQLSALHAAPPILPAAATSEFVPSAEALHYWIEGNKASWAAQLKENIKAKAMMSALTCGTGLGFVLNGGWFLIGGVLGLLAAAASGLLWNDRRTLLKRMMLVEEDPKSPYYYVPNFDQRVYGHEPHLGTRIYPVDRFEELLEAVRAHDANHFFLNGFRVVDVSDVGPRLPAAPLGQHQPTCCFRVSGRLPGDTHEYVYRFTASDRDALIRLHRTFQVAQKARLPKMLHVSTAVLRDGTMIIDSVPYIGPAITREAK